MPKIRIRELLSGDRLNQQVTVSGWVRSKRESKGVGFIALGDGSCHESLQAVIAGDSTAAEHLHSCTTGASVRVTGILRESPAKGQRFELDATGIEVLGTADSLTYPLQKKGHSLEFLREIGHLRPRSNTFGAVFRVRSVLAHAIHEFFQSRGFLWVHTPVITASDCEGAGDLFTVTGLDPDNPPRRDGRVDFSQDFFGTRSFLTVSGQLEAEFLAMSLGDVYTFGPTFRAENSNTSRHLAEFWMVEPEMAFADLRDDMELAEEFFKSLCRTVADRSEEDLVFLHQHYRQSSPVEIRALAEKKFVHMTYTEAIDELLKSGAGFTYPVSWGLDLQSEHERFLTDTLCRGPVIVTDYPREIKAFYMRLNPDEKTVAAMDVLVPRIGEIIGGSQREERFDVLSARMRQAGIPDHEMDWYLDLRRFGTAPHAGFGLGFERMVQYITGMPNIRDVIPCPRGPGEIKF